MRVGRDHLEAGRLQGGAESRIVWFAWWRWLADIVDDLPPLLEVAFVETARRHDDEHSARLERLERMRCRARHMQEIARAQLDLLIPELETIPTGQHEHSL